MKIFRYIYLLIFLWFSNEVKASLSFYSGLGMAYCFGKGLFSKEPKKNVIFFPFGSKIKFLTLYNFDLGFVENNSIIRGSGKERLFYIRFYLCKNEITSFIPSFHFFISKRKKIKKIFERVDFCFDFFLPLLSFYVFLLTKDGKNLKFFHSPEPAYEENEGEANPFVFFSIFFNKKKIISKKLADLKKKREPDNVDNFFSFLYCAASCFSFCFDNIMICPYLFCCIKFPIEGVFFFVFILKYLLLKKECNELLAEHNKKEDNEQMKEGTEEYLCKNLWGFIKEQFLVGTFLNMVVFSIKIF